MRKDVRTFIRECNTCQRNKVETLHPASLLQPLPILKKNWVDINMDFVEGLPPSKGYIVVIVVVDRLSKFSNLLPLHHPYIALNVARIFIENVLKLHRLSQTIVSDRDSVFTSRFWVELFRLCGIELLLSSAYHP
ncbi:hypothetical protein I3760_15G132600 [Carya illinoinensis]|nr:hypothetical protein I3760_15G132600 [Carya illinoinensis]